MPTESGEKGKEPSLKERYDGHWSYLIAQAEEIPAKVSPFIYNHAKYTKEASDALIAKLEAASSKEEGLKEVRDGLEGILESSERPGGMRERSFEEKYHEISSGVREIITEIDRSRKGER